jgi:hypothetical protein
MREITADFSVGCTLIETRYGKAPSPLAGDERAFSGNKPSPHVSVTKIGYLVITHLSASAATAQCNLGNRAIACTQTAPIIF